MSLNGNVRPVFKVETSVTEFFLVEHQKTLVEALDAAAKKGKYKKVRMIRAEIDANSRDLQNIRKQNEIKQ